VLPIMILFFTQDLPPRLLTVSPPD
jgi:hypothetical protein